MFEVVVSDRFAVWYEGLPEVLAEEVTLALDVAASLGKGIDPVRSRPMLLWYDGTQGAKDAQRVARYDRHVRLLMWGRRVRNCLASREFQEKLAELDAAQARQALEAVERVKNVLASSRLLHLLGVLGSEAHIPLSPSEQWLYELLLTERAAQPALPLRVGGRQLAAVSALVESPEPIYLATLEALRRVGLSPRVFLDERTGLRELMIGGASERHRLICGVDVPRRRVIAIVGERLDRSYYGDSVKFAEAYFRDYLAQEDPAQVVAEEP